MNGKMSLLVELVTCACNCMCQRVDKTQLLQQQQKVLRKKAMLEHRLHFSLCDASAQSADTGLLPFISVDAWLVPFVCCKVNQGTWLKGKTLMLQLLKGKTLMRRNASVIKHHFFFFFQLLAWCQRRDTKIHIFFQLLSWYQISDKKPHIFSNCYHGVR